jgi:putative spermidine/putrescine transport system permease protein
MALPTYATPLQRAWHWIFLALCAMIFLFLIAPILVIMPLSFSSEPWFTYPLPGLSTRWYDDFFSSQRWQSALFNSVFIALAATALATTLGTIAALGLSRPEFPFRPLIMGLIISPMVVPIVITAVGMYFFYARMGLANTFIGIILAHTALATPFVVITVTATLAGFDYSLTRAAAGLGAGPVTVFRRVTLPLILPGLISGALFAFVTSFDEVVVVLFVAAHDQQTIPRQMWNGIREQISPAILAVATILVVVSVALLTVLELLRRRSERLRGVTPA